MKNRIFFSVLALFLSAPTLLTAQKNKAGEIVKAYYAAFDAGNIAEMEKLLSPDFTATAPFLPGPTLLAAWKEIGAGLKTAFPDMQHPIKDWFTDGKKVASFCAANSVQYFSGSPNPVMPDEIKKRAAGYKTGFPDVKREIQEIVVAGNSVTVRGLFTGTNTGMFMGKPATGKKVSIPYLALFHLNANGLIEKGYIEFDTKLVEKQLVGEMGVK